MKFIRTALARAGAEELITPREIIRDFLTLLNILRDNENARFDELLARLTFGGTSEEQTEEKTTESTTHQKVSIFDIEL